MVMIVLSEFGAKSPRHPKYPTFPIFLYLGYFLITPYASKKKKKLGS